jgi:hypothetical protein
MKKSILVMTAILSFSLLPTDVNAASKNASAASEHSVKAIGHATASTAQIASAVVAVPLIAVGSVGSVAMVAGESLMNNAADDTSRPVDTNKPLEISSVTITVDRTPAEQMAKNSEDK